MSRKPEQAFRRRRISSPARQALTCTVKDGQCVCGKPAVKTLRYSGARFAYGDAKAPVDVHLCKGHAS